jgi:hypothetical protein
MKLDNRIIDIFKDKRFKIILRDEKIIYSEVRIIDIFVSERETLLKVHILECLHEIKLININNILKIEEL